MRHRVKDTNTHSLDLGILRILDEPWGMMAAVVGAAILFGLGIVTGGGVRGLEAYIGPASVWAFISAIWMHKIKSSIDIQVKHLLNEEQHHLARSLEAAKARITRNEQWIAQEMAALVDLNRLYWSLYPTITHPNPEMDDVYAAVERNRDKHVQDIRKFLDTFEVFVPIGVVDMVRDAKDKLEFSYFDPDDQPNITGSGKEAFDLMYGARQCLLAQVELRRKEEASTL